MPSLHDLMCAMVEHSDLLLAPFRIGEPLAGGPGYTLTECWITKILGKRAFFRNKNRPPAAGNRVHASTAPPRVVRSRNQQKTSIWCDAMEKKPTGQEPRAARFGRIGQARRRPLSAFFSRPFGCVSVGISGVGRLNRMSAFRRPILYLPRRKRNAGRMEVCEMGAKFEEIRSIFK